MTGPPSAVAAATALHVAPLLPPTAELPIAPRRIGFVRAFLFFWLIPRRYGPHLAVSSWKRAILAHLLAVLFAGATAGATATIVYGWSYHVNVPRELHQLRLDLALLVIDMAAASAAANSSARGWGGWVGALLIAAAIPLAELALVALGILLMPWCAGGDSARSVFRRSVKNVYWMTTAFIPLTAIWCACILLLESEPHWLKWRFGILEIALVIGPCAATLVVLLRIMLIGASRYAGPPDGPAFRPREPLCEQCGYLMVGLPFTSTCPECGLAVGDSLPGGRRRPTEWQKNELTFRGLLDLLRLQWRILRDSEFFKRLPVQQGHSTARHFWWGTYLLIVAIVLSITRLLLTNDFGPSGGLTVLAAAIVVLPIFAQLLTTFVACLWSQVTLGIRDFRVAATVCYYTSPLMWPAVIVLTIAILLSGIVGGSLWRRHAFSVQRFRFTYGDLCTTAFAAVFIGCLLFWWIRLGAALRDVRYANV